MTLGLPDWLESRIIPEPNTGCWLWEGALSEGYGAVGVPRTKRTAAVHILVYEYLVGPIPKNLECDHLCLNKSCCNPDHIEPVTHKINMWRHFARKTHCKHGHSLADAYVWGGHRYCRVCHSERSAKNNLEISKRERRNKYRWAKGKTRK